MTGGAGTDAATGVIEKNVEVFGYVEERHGLSMMPIGEGAVGKLHHTAFGKECDANHVVSHRLYFLSINSAWAMGCGAVGPWPRLSPADCMVCPLMAVDTAASIISSAKRWVALSNASVPARRACRSSPWLRTLSSALRALISVRSSGSRSCHAGLEGAFSNACKMVSASFLASTNWRRWMSSSA